jgi:hypothetical protein
MEYIVSLFAEREQAAHAAEMLRTKGFSDDDYDVRAPQETRTLKGWLERLFDMPEPLSGMEAEGVPHDASQWYEEQVEAGGQTLMVVRVEDGASEIAALLEHAGAHHVRRYAQRDQAWTALSGPDT